MNAERKSRLLDTIFAYFLAVAIVCCVLFVVDFVWSVVSGSPMLIDVLINPNCLGELL